MKSNHPRLTSFGKGFGMKHRKVQAIASKTRRPRERRIFHVARDGAWEVVDERLKFIPRWEIPEILGHPQPVPDHVEIILLPLAAAVPASSAIVRRWLSRPLHCRLCNVCYVRADKLGPIGGLEDFPAYECRRVAPVSITIAEAPLYREERWS